MNRRAIVLSAFLISVTSAAHGEDDLRFQVTPYLWGPGLSGNIHPGTSLPEIDIDRSLNDILSDLEAAFFLTGTIRANRVVALGDFTWAKLNEDSNVGVPATSITPHFNVSMGLDVELYTATAAVGYSVVQEETLVVDLLAGVRMWGVDTSVKVTHPVAQLPSKFHDDEKWVDPLLVARGRLELDDNWSAILYSDIGGFGAGSDLTWQGLATLNYEMSDTLYLSMGYRYLALDYSDGGLKLEIQLGGPLAGVTYLF